MKNKRALVTGANGTIGSGLVEELKRRGYEVKTLSMKDIGSYDLELVLNKFLPTVFFHCAAVISDRVQPFQYVENVRMIVEVCQAIGSLPFNSRPLLINLSSVAEVGDPGSSANIKEDIRCFPVSHYGISKLCQTEIALSLAHRFDFRCICPRIFNIVAVSDEKNLLNQWLGQIKIANSEVVNLKVGDLDIERDFLTYDDVIENLCLIADNTSFLGLLNICSGRGVFLRDLLERVMDLSDKKIIIELDSKLIPAKRISRVVGDNSLLLRLGGVFDLEKFNNQLNGFILNRLKQ